MRVYNVVQSAQRVPFSVMVSNHVNAAKPRETSNASTTLRCALRKTSYAKSFRDHAIDKTTSTSSWPSLLSQGYPTRFRVICTSVTLQIPS